MVSVRPLIFIKICMPNTTTMYLCENGFLGEAKVPLEKKINQKERLHPPSINIVRQLLHKFYRTPKKCIFLCGDIPISERRLTRQQSRILNSGAFVKFRSSQRCNYQQKMTKSLFYRSKKESTLVCYKHHNVSHIPLLVCNSQT